MNCSKKLDFEDNTFDFVFSKDMFECVPDKDLLVSEIHRILKPGGVVYQDLVYNKWWTRDAKATTNAEGKATVRGFYGDYDVTVNANGKTKTVMAAYHKGYDNVLEITVE